MGHSGPLFLYFRLFVNMIVIKSCRWLDSNCGLLVLEATALPSEPHHCPNQWFLVTFNIVPNLLNGHVTAGCQGPGDRGPCPIHLRQLRVPMWATKLQVQRQASRKLSQVTLTFLFLVEAHSIPPKSRHSWRNELDVADPMRDAKSVKVQRQNMEKMKWLVDYYESKGRYFLSPTPTLMAFTGVTNAHDPHPSITACIARVGLILAIPFDAIISMFMTTTTTAYL